MILVAIMFASFVPPEGPDPREAKPSACACLCVYVCVFRSVRVYGQESQSISCGAGVRSLHGGAEWFLRLRPALWRVGSSYYPAGEESSRGLEQQNLKLAPVSHSWRDHQLPEDLDAGGPRRFSDVCGRYSSRPSSLTGAQRRRENSAAQHRRLRNLSY